jgi:cytochrome c oxidase subunit 2
VPTSGLLALAALADTADHAQSPLNPAGPEAQRISDLFWIITIPALLVLLIVGGMIVVAAFKFRRKSEDDAWPAQIGGNNALEFTWTLVPALILLAIFAISLPQLPFLRNLPAEAAGAKHIKVIGRQWAWSFEYPGGVKTFGVLTIPAGEAINLDIESLDVIHSWSVPRLAGKIDAIPGQHNTAWVMANDVGIYYGQCTEFCGLSHSAMLVKVVALSQHDFDAWYLKQKGGH